MSDPRALARRDALARLGALDGANTLGLDKAARLAQFISGARYAAVHLIDDAHQHRVASAGGVPLEATPISDSMCVKVVEAQQPVTVPDATQDDRFDGNPFTSGADPVRFYSASPLRDAGGLVLGTLCVYDTQRIELDPERQVLLADVAEQVAQHLRLHGLVQDLAEEALHDPLTGLPNRRLLSDRLAQAMARRDRQPGEPTLVMLDLDGFKLVNDTLGHATGDALLVEVAARLLRVVRPEDTVARLGGDEFVVLCLRAPDEPGGQSGGQLCQRLRQAFADPFDVAGHQLRLATSIGLASSLPHELGYELLGRADKAMYDDKSARQAGTAPAG